MRLIEFTVTASCPRCAASADLHHLAGTAEEELLSLEGVCPRCSTAIEARFRRPNPDAFELIPAPNHTAWGWAGLWRDGDVWEFVPAAGDEPGAVRLGWRL